MDLYSASLLVHELGHSYEFKMLTDKKYINFKGWGTFHKLYKTERFIYYIENFMIMNMPIIAKVAFKLRYIILKLTKKKMI